MPTVSPRCWPTAGPAPPSWSGGGFIGLETAENLRRRGWTVSLVELDRQALVPLDPEMVTAVHAELLRHGVSLFLGTALTKVLPDAVELADGTVLDADLVVLAIGIRPEAGLARAAGLVVGPRGGIAVDDTMRTSDPHIFAVGDAVEKTDLISGEPALIPLANTANRQGRLAADAIAGRPRSGRVLGAQAVGGDGVDKRIDVIATAMRAGLTADQLADLELAYAPAYGPAKDPVNMLGYIADNSSPTGNAPFNGTDSTQPSPPAPP